MISEKTIIPVGIDLGAKYTGVFIAPISKNNDGCPEINKNHTVAATIVMPNDDKMTYSLTSRTATRHRIRGNKRFSLARRLFTLLINEVLERAETRLSREEFRAALEACSGLLKRRGYSRTESETDLSILDFVDPSIFKNAPIIGKYFEDDTLISYKWDEITKEISTIRQFLEDAPSVRDFEKSLPRDLEKADRKEAVQAFKAIIEDAESIVNQEVMGHKPRLEYLNSIRHDLNHGDSRLNKVIDSFGGTERFWRFTGNISNLPLRILRWYFNDRTMAAEDRFDSARLQEALIRGFQYFHPDEDSKDRLHDVIHELKNSTDIIETICTIDPVQTIPPYEDQNNRRPPIDHTLYLSPEKLDALFKGRWRVWSNRLAKESPQLLEDLDEILNITDRRSRIPQKGRTAFSKDVYKDCYILQRAFDRTSAIDPYSIRRLSNNSLREAARLRCLERLESTLGSQHVSEFLKCASLYYQDVDSAKIGLCFPETSNLLERSNIHPPMKKRILDLLVGNIIQRPELGKVFIDDVWHRTVKGRSTVCSNCKAIEKLRKDNGNDFNRKLQEARSHEEQRLKDKTTTLTNEDKEFLNIERKIIETAEFIKDSLDLTDSECQRFSNAFSLAQLYTIIETERNGFTSVTLAAHKETIWRMRQAVAVSESGDRFTVSNASRLPADAARPFDGVIRRLIDRTSWEAVKLVSETIRKEVPQNNCTVRIPIIIEENRFEFSASLADLKRNSAARKKMLARSERQNAQWRSKDERIKATTRSPQGFNICPYTGKHFTTHGEIDHIIPRSITSKYSGTIFNSEANLIYVSQEGNQKKGNSTISIRNLAPEYLNLVFHTSNVNEIQTRIEATIARLLDEHRMKYFDLLEPNEQIDFRHALFLDNGNPAYNAVFDTLRKQRSSKVNGTQLWFIRNFCQKLSSELDAWCKAHGNRLEFYGNSRSPGDGSSSLRNELGAQYAEMKKTAIQPVASHSIDASCVLFSELFNGNGKAFGHDQSANEYSGIFEDLSPEQQRQLIHDTYPEPCRVIQVERKSLAEKSDFGGSPIFKEGIYSENYLPIFTLNSSIFIGFHSKQTGNSFIQVSGKNPESILRVLSPYLDKEVIDISKNNIYHIDRSKAALLFSRITMQDTSQEEQRAARIIKTITYFTKRTSAIGLFYDIQKKKLLPQEEALNDKLFTLKVGLQKDKEIQVKGIITLPLKKAWTSLYDNVIDALQHKNEEAASENPEENKPVTLTENDVRTAISKSWKKPEKESRHLKHIPVHRDLSMPVVDSPSGGFRIQRRKLDGSPLWQVQAVNTKVRGFASIDGIVDWSSTVPFDAFRKEGITSIDPQLHSKITEVTPMNEWRMVINEDEIRAWLSPGTADRFYARITVPFDTLKKWLSAGCKDLEDLNHYLRMDASLKIKDPKAFFDSMPTNLKAVVSQPRGIIYFEEIGSSMTFRYMVQSNNSQMKNAYNSAKKAQ